MNVLGIHLLLELRQCNPVLLNDLDYIRDVMVAIAESHISIHTWPEYGYAAADVFTCSSSLHPQIVADLLIEKLECLDPYVHEIQRGMIPQTVTT